MIEVQEVIGVEEAKEAPEMIEVEEVKEAKEVQGSHGLRKSMVHETIKALEEKEAVVKESLGRRRNTVLATRKVQEAKEVKDQDVMTAVTMTNQHRPKEEKTDQKASLHHW